MACGDGHHLPEVVEVAAGVVHERHVEQPAAAVLEQQVVEQLAGPSRPAARARPATRALGRGLVVGRIGEGVHPVEAAVDEAGEVGAPAARRARPGSGPAASGCAGPPPARRGAGGAAACSWGSGRAGWRWRPGRCSTPMGRTATWARAVGARGVPLGDAGQQLAEAVGRLVVLLHGEAERAARPRGRCGPAARARGPPARRRPTGRRRRSAGSRPVPGPAQGRGDAQHLLGRGASACRSARPGWCGAPRCARW